MEGFGMEGFSTELLLKIPKGKPPVIGVVFTRVKEACEMNQDLVNDFPDLPYYIRFKNSSSRGINFELASEKLNGCRTYKDIKFDPIKLENFLFMTRDKSLFSFVHLLYDFDQYQVVATFDKYKRFELKVQRLYMMG